MKKLRYFYNFVINVFFYNKKNGIVVKPALVSTSIKQQINFHFPSQCISY